MRMTSGALPVNQISSFEACHFASFSVQQGLCASPPLITSPEGLQTQGKGGPWTPKSTRRQAMEVTLPIANKGCKFFVSLGHWRKRVYSMRHSTLRLQPAMHCRTSSWSLLPIKLHKLSRIRLSATLEFPDTRFRQVFGEFHCERI